MGRAGERIAEMHLQRSGFAVLERNWKQHSGELDLILLKDGVLVFCEVKTRKEKFVEIFPPFAAVDREKQARIIFLARQYRRKYQGYLRRVRAASTRFDVVIVQYRGDLFGAARVRHYTNAFRASALV